MIWQDIVVALANILFGYSLIFQVSKGFKERKGFIAFQTAFFTTLGLYAVTIVYFSLNLLLSSIISFFNGSMWLILLVQRLAYKKV
jgi:hypothetical protein